MSFNLKLPGFLSGKKGSASSDAAFTTVIDLAHPVVNKKASPGFMGKYSVIKRLQVLGTILVVIMLIVAALIYRDNRVSAQGSVYIATAGEMRMLSQRLAKASARAIQGDAGAFAQLRDSYGQFSTDLHLLSNGGERADARVPPSPEEVQPQLQELIKAWAATEKNTLQMLDMESYLVGLNKDVRTIIDRNSQMFDLTERVATLKLNSNGSAREVATANQLMMLTQRMARNAGSFLAADEVGQQVPAQIAKDTATFRDLLTALISSAAGDSEARTGLKQLEAGFSGYESTVKTMLANNQRLLLARQAQSRIFRDSESLLEATGTLAHAYQQVSTERLIYGLTLASLILLALAALAMMAKTYLEETRRQAELADQSRRVSETVNRQNQDAILRLMNELGDLADGDLTVTATVSEDITGAIADSINYTIEELRVLVGRINDAAGRVTIATGIAQQTSAELLDATKRQSQEIQDAGRSVLVMASSMSKVSGEADQSAQVARQSLTAAGKGTLAVQDSIKGMNEIREQIQETSKRIKRLGESSQEIGEIVELISDITEQTNVLALNAAIQAASAGDAGRGFTVVAEEVQRLAERSGEATKQIAAIVKTIQTDTQGAVSAMEESTRGVVEGAKLSDAAGQALSEIGEVSQNLAELIENISDATRQQADSATGVVAKMQDILRVTEQTTAGTQKTATAVGELAGLATELKGSVAGFKVG